VALAAPAASGDLAPGRWAVQVGVFFVANSAEAVRARVAAQLAQSDIPADRATRVVRRDNRYFVVVGDAADQGSAQALANQVRAALRQDVVLFRR
jgi:cell division protein FtsN